MLVTGGAGFVGSHLWPNAHTVTTFYHIEVSDDKVKINDEHRDHKWVTEPPRDLHPTSRRWSRKQTYSTSIRIEDFDKLSKTPS